MPQDLDALKEEFAAQCRRAAGYGLMLCSSGNMSRRLDDGTMLVTGTRTWMSRLAADDVGVVGIEDGELRSGAKPSVETGFHAGVLRARPDADVVLHFQTPFATALACTDCSDVDFYVLPEIPYYIGPVATVAFHLPGSRELASAVVDELARHNMVILRNHGQVTLGRDYDEAIQRAVFFEMACAAIVRAGDALEPIPAHMAEQVEESGRAGRPGA